jgi:hypothetical protein
MWLPIIFLTLCRSVINNAATNFTLISLHLSESRENVYIRLKNGLYTFVTTVGYACLEERALFLERS